MHSFVQWFHLVQVQRWENHTSLIISREQFHPIGAPRQRCDGTLMEANYIKTSQLEIQRKRGKYYGYSVPCCPHQFFHLFTAWCFWHDIFLWQRVIDCRWDYRSRLSFVKKSSQAATNNTTSFFTAAWTRWHHSFTGLHHISTEFLTCLFRPGSGDTSWKTATRPDAVPTATRSSKQLSNFTAVIASLLPWKYTQMDTDVGLECGF